MKKISKVYVRDIFLKLVKIDSESGNEDNVREFLISELRKNNVIVKKDSYGNIIGKLKGQGESIFLSAHMDTVKPGKNIKPVIKKDVIYSSGDTVLGADDKAGIAEILGVIKFIKDNKIKHQSLEIIFTREEELGLVGAFNLDYKSIKSKKGLVVDISGEPETIVLASPYIAMIDIEVIGKTVHAGHNPEDGINAIEVSADAISKLKFGRIDEETISNIGIIKGGEVLNSVPGFTNVQIEVRSHVRKKITEQIKIFKNTFKKSADKYGAKIKFEYEIGCKGYKYSENNKFVKQIIEQWKEMDKKAIIKKVGSGSDANAFTQNKIQAIPIGYAGKHPHSTKECVSVEDMVLVSQFLINFISLK